MTTPTYIYGVEHSGDVHALVLEFVDGPTLADRIAAGPVPLDEALPIAKQIADALAAAHEQSIVHRDLKPSNIKLRADGTVKVLDFGLAKAISTADVGRNFSSAGSAGQDPAYVLSQSPTITSPVITGGGMILASCVSIGVDNRKTIAEMAASFVARWRC